MSNNNPLKYIDTNLAEAFKEFADTFPSDTCFMHKHSQRRESIEQQQRKAYDLMYAKGY